MIKYLIAILLTTTAAYSQTIKTLGYNATNGRIAYSGSNTLTFTNPVKMTLLELQIYGESTNTINADADGMTFKNTSPTRTNVFFYTDMGNGGTNPAVTFNSQISFTSFQNAQSKTRANLGLGSFNSTNGWGELYDGVGNLVASTEDGFTIYHGSLGFGGTNSDINRSQTRTNLGLGWIALTNTNASNFRTAIGLGTLATNNTVPSGAAASNSLLTADGAGGSSFVASKTVTVVKSSDQSRTNDASLTTTNNNDQELTQNVTAGSIYHIAVRLEISTGTIAGFNAGIVTGTNNVFSSTSQTVGTAMRHNLNTTGFYISTASGGSVAQITFGGNGIAGSAVNNAWTATGIFRCAANGTLTVRWAQFVATNQTTTLHAGSSFTLTKLN